MARLTDTRQVRDRRTGRVTTVGQRNQRKLQNDILDLNFRRQTQERKFKSTDKTFQELGGEDELLNLQFPLSPLNEEKQKKLEALQAASAARDSAKKRFDTTSKQLEAKKEQQALIPQSPVGAARQAGQLPPAQNQQRAARDVNQGVPTQQRQQQQLRQPQQQQQQQTQTADLPTALNTFANSKVGSDLLAAATKMQEINAAGGLKFEWQGTVKPIEVILNGAGLLASLTDDVKAKLTPLIAEEVEKQMKLNINN